MSGDFLHLLKPEERDLLRRIVKMVHFKHYPEEVKTDYEADKLIATIVPEVIEKLIKAGVDFKIDKL